MKKMIWMFAGQGAQYYQMGRELYEGEPGFREFLEQGDRLVQRLINESVVEILYRPRPDRFEPFRRLLYTHPAILLFECATIEALSRRGLRPDYVLGYSLGEYACHVAANALTFDEALGAVIKQAELTEYCAPRGGMMAIIDSVDLVTRHPAPFRECSIAAHHFSRSFVVSAANGALARLRDFLKGTGVSFLDLPVDYPFHSSLIEGLRTPVDTLLSRLPLSPPQVPIISASNGAILERPSANHLWASMRDPVDLATTIRRLETSGPYLYVDLGPSGSMATAVKYNLAKDSRSEFLTISSPFGHEGKNLETLMERYAASRTHARP